MKNLPPNLPSGASDMAHIVLTFDNNKLASALYGQFDENLARLEQKLGVDIRSRGNQLTIKGDRKSAVPEKGVRHRQERGFGNFVRVLALPFAVDADKVEARFENGVLQIKLAKHESAKPRKIHVKVAQ